jgi:hypothetical protein
MTYEQNRKSLENTVGATPLVLPERRAQLAEKLAAGAGADTIANHRWLLLVAYFF